MDEENRRTHSIVIIPYDRFGKPERSKSITLRGSKLTVSEIYDKIYSALITEG
jgi:hypothetical protein